MHILDCILIFLSLFTSRRKTSRLHRWLCKKRYLKELHEFPMYEIPTEARMNEIREKQDIYNSHESVKKQLFSSLFGVSA